MNYTYETTSTGYRIFVDGVLYIDQPFKPGIPGFEPFESEAAAASAAEAAIAEMTAEGEE